MGQIPEHSKLITAAARKTLRPMGLRQRGRSRTWLDDHGWWLCVVEFQPSSWARGSYLNVGCCWLWSVKDYLSFNEGHRVEGFSEFEDPTQFDRVAARLAERAAQEVERYRELFPDVRRVSDFYLERSVNAFWPTFHAGVASLLSGRLDEARRFFAEVKADEDQRDWVRAAEADARELMAAASAAEKIQDLVGQRVCRARALLKLPPLDSLDFGE